MEVLKTTKGGPKVVFDRYLYTKSKTSANRTKCYWSCVRRPYGYKGSLITTSEPYGDPRPGTAHNHPRNSLSVEIAKARQTMKERASRGETSIRVYREVCASGSEDLRDIMPTSAICARTMRRARAETHPTAVKKLAELIFEGDWLTTGGANPEQFL